VGVHVVIDTVNLLDYAIVLTCLLRLSLPAKSRFCVLLGSELRSA